MSLPELRSSEGALTTISVHKDMLDGLTGIAYRRVGENGDFVTLELTWTMHARLLGRLAEIPPPAARKKTAARRR